MKQKVLEQMIATNRAWKRCLQLGEEYKETKQRLMDIEHQLNVSNEVHQGENKILAELLSKCSDEDLPDFKL